MPLIEWGKELETGIRIIDKQHRQWVDLINDLGRAVEAGHEESVLRATVDALWEYTTYHFRTEEGLMERHGYDAEELALHRREHRVFTDQIEIFRDRIGSGFQKMTPRVIDYMYDWLVTHITASDRGYIQTLQNGGVE